MIELRPYQREATDCIAADFERGLKRLLIVLATGTGKTTVFSEVVARSQGRVLVIAHRTELVEQAKARLEAYTGEKVGIDKAERYSTFERIVVASVQTVSRDRRLERIDRLGSPTLIVVDEAHHCLSPTWQKVIDRWPTTRVLGVTATPDRGDKMALGKIFEKVSYSYDMSDAVKDGYLVPLSGVRVQLKVDLDKIEKRGGDFMAGVLDKAMVKQSEAIAQGSLRAAGDQQGIIFCPGVQTAHYVAERLNVLRPGCAASIDGKTDPEARAATLEKFRRGELQWLCNCMVFTEGTDLPMASVVAMARPTHSRALYAQCVGRIGRPEPGRVDGLSTAEERRRAIANSNKPSGLIVDFVGSSKHSLATPIDILGGDYTEEEKAVAKRIAGETEPGEEQEPAAVEEALNLARAELRKVAEQVKAKVEMQAHAFDPLVDAGVADGTDSHIPAAKQKVVPTSKQAEYLRMCGIKPDVIEELSKKSASQLIDRIKERQRNGLATVRQMGILAKYGAAMDGATKEAASRAISYIAESGWGKSTDPEEVRRIIAGD